MAEVADHSEKVVSTVDDLVRATQRATVRQIFVKKSLDHVPRISLSPGQRLWGDGDRISLKFTSDSDGIGLSRDNQISMLHLETSPSCRAIWNEPKVESLGTIELSEISTIGRVQILVHDMMQGGHVDVHNLDIVSADALAEKERPQGYGVGVVQGAFTLWNMRRDEKVAVSADLVGLSAGRYGRPALGSGIFISGAGDRGGRVTVQRLEVGSVYSDAKIAPGTPDTISCGVFTGKGANVDTVRITGPVVTYGANDMALDNWGTVDRWVAEGKITTHGPSGIGFVNFGDVGELSLKSPVETFGLGARGFNVYDGSVGSAEFDRIVTHADGAVGVQIARSVGRLVIHRGIETFGGIGQSLVKGVLQNLSAIALSIKPGGHIRSAQITGGLRTNGKGMPPLEQLGIVESLSIAGGFHGADSEN